MRFRRTFFPLLLPLLAIGIATLTLWKWPGLLNTVQGTKELRALLIMLPVLPYAVFAVGILMGWRHNNIGLILTFLVLALTYLTLIHAGTGMTAAKKQGLFIPEAVGFLLPLNLTLFSMLTKRRILTAAFVICFLLVLLQTFAVLLLCSWPGAQAPVFTPFIKNISPTLAAAMTGASIRLGSFFHANALTAAFHWLSPGVLSFCGALMFMLAQFLYRRDPFLAGFSGALSAVFLGMIAAKPVPAATIGRL